MFLHPTVVSIYTIALVVDRLSDQDNDVVWLSHLGRGRGFRQNSLMRTLGGGFQIVISQITWFNFVCGCTLNVLH